MNKSNLPSEKTQHKHLNLLVIHHNHMVATARNLKHLLNDDNNGQVEELISCVKSKLQNILLRLNIGDKVPTSLDKSFVFNLEEDSEEEDTSSEDNRVRTDSIFSEATMADRVKFIELACKILPDFDGTVENLQRFIDALSLLDTLKDTHETVAIQLIKTKLLGTARNYITEETTIQQIIAKLRSSIKGESAESITCKILNTKQLNKNTSDYTKEIEQLTKALNNAYLADGLEPEKAKKYSTQIAVQSMAKNANNEKIKLIMEVGKFDNIAEATAKFTSVADDRSTSQPIFHVRTQRDNQNNNGTNRYRGTYYNRYRGRNHNNLNRYNNTRNNGSPQNRNYQNPHNNNNGNFRGNNYNNRREQQNNSRSDSRNIRVIEQDSENQ